MAAEISMNYIAKIAGSFDAKQLIQYESGLTSETYWGQKYPYKGMLVITRDTCKAFICTDADNITDINSWKDITGGGSGSGETSGGLTREEIEEILAGYYTQGEVDGIIDTLTGDLQTQYETLDSRYDNLSGTVKTIRENINADIEQLRTGITANENEITLAVKNLSGNMISYIDMTAEGLTSTVASLSGFDFSQITQDIDNITATISSLSGLDVTRLETEIGAIRGTVADFSAGTIAELEITSNAITSRVGDLSSSTISYIKQTAEDIATQVGDLSGATSQIEQAANGIYAAVYDPEVGLAALRMTAGSLRSDIDSLSGGASQILQKAEEITLSVRDSLSGSMISYIDTRVGQVEMGVSSGDVKANVVAWINEGAGTSEVKIAADAIQIDGDTGIDGKLTARKLAATAGTIGDIVIKQQSIHSNNFIDANGERTGNGFSLNADGTIVATNIALSGNVYANAGSIGGITIAEDEIISNGYNKGSNTTGFALTKNGNLYATNASISGTVYSSNAIISGTVYATTLVVGQSEELENYIRKVTDENGVNNNIDTSSFSLNGAVLAKNAAIQNQLLVGEGDSMVNIYQGGITANTGQIGELKLNYIDSGNTYNIQQNTKEITINTTEIVPISAETRSLDYDEQIEIIGTKEIDFSQFMTENNRQEIEDIYNNFLFPNGYAYVDLTYGIYMLSGEGETRIPLMYDIELRVEKDTDDTFGYAAYLMTAGSPEIISKGNSLNGDHPITLSDICNAAVRKFSGSTKYVFVFRNRYEERVGEPIFDYFQVQFKGNYISYKNVEKQITGYTSGYTYTGTTNQGDVNAYIYPLYHENFKVDNNGKMTARDAVIENSDGNGYELRVTDTEFLAGKVNNGNLVSGITINNVGITTDTGKSAGVQIKGGLDVDLLSINRVEIGGSNGTSAKIEIVTDSWYQEHENSLDPNTLYITY